MKKLLFSTLTFMSFGLYCPAMAPRRAPTHAASALVAPLAPLAPTAQQTKPTAPVVAPENTDRKLSDTELISYLQQIVKTLGDTDKIDQKIDEYKKLITALKALKTNSISPSKQTVIREVLYKIIEEIDTMIEENADGFLGWMRDTYQVSQLKHCRAEISSLVTKFSGLWHGWTSQASSFWKLHWRAPIKAFAAILPVLLVRAKYKPAVSK